MIVLALLVACDGGFDPSEQLERTGLLDTDSDDDTDTDVDTNTDSDDDPDPIDPVPADSDTDTDTDPPPTPGTGGARGEPCANGPLAEPIPDCRPQAQPSTGDPHADCVARINRFRWECQCLPPLERWTDGESCTDSNAQYDSVNGAHASFYDIPCGSGARAQNECPGWPSTQHVVTGCLQAMWDEGPEDGNPNTVNGHYEAMATTQYTRVACGFFTTPEGDVWGVQNFD
jgi:hypothetical protein